MARYRIERTLPTGWRIRLDYVPWNGTLAESPTMVDGVALLEIGDHTAEFDTLPFGMTEPHTLKLKLALNYLPAGMSQALQEGQDPTLPPAPVPDRNVFVLYSDRGTNGATWTTEFVGCEDVIEGFDAVPEAGDIYSYEIELVDVVYHAMKSVDARYFWLTLGTLPELNRAYDRVFQTLTTNERGRNQFHDLFGYARRRYSWLSEILDKYAANVGAVLSEHYLRGVPALNAFVNASQLRKVADASLTLYRSTYESLPRTAGAALAADEIALMTLIDSGGGIVGGLLNAADKYAWARSDTTAYDVMRDLCEAFGVKMSYGIEISEVLGSPAYTITWRPRRIGSPNAGDNHTTGYDAQVGALRMTERPSTRRGESNIGKVEIRWESEYQEDAKQIVYLQTGSRGSRSINVEPIVHNAPVFLPEEDMPDGRRGPMVQTNQLYFKRPESGQTTLVLVHENTRYKYLPDVVGGYVEATTTAGREPVVNDDNEGNYRIQLNAIQTSATMAVALAKFYRHTFAHPDNASVETTWSALRTTAVMPHNVGAVHDLSFNNDGGTGGESDFSALLTRLPWGRAILTSSTHNWMTGEVTTRYFLMAATGNVA
jgi:hypothetical protein